MKTKNTKAWPNKVRPRRLLTYAEDRVVSIRKNLRHEFGAELGLRPRVREDAVAICSLIERLAQRGRNVSAAQAIEYVELVEFLLIRLEELLMALLATRRRHVIG